MRNLTICIGVSLAAHAALLTLSFPPQEIGPKRHAWVEVGLIFASPQHRNRTPQIAEPGAHPVPPQHRQPPAPHRPPPEPIFPAPVPPGFTPAANSPLENRPARAPMPQAPTMDAGKAKMYSIGSNTTSAQRSGMDRFSNAAAPHATSNLPPPYPRQAREQGWAGSVWLQIRIGANGLVDTVQLEQSSGYPLLDETAIAAVRDWKFESDQSGRAIATTVRVPIRFRLEND